MRRTAAKLLALWVAAAGLALAAAPTVIRDPKAFVAEVYRKLAASGDYTPPEDIYTPRLKRLIDRDRRLAKGEVGCLDGIFWVNGQDWELSEVVVTASPAANDRQVVTATFRNSGTPEEIQLEFQRIGGAWRLDEARSLASDRWTLTGMLNCKR